MSLRKERRRIARAFEVALLAVGSPAIVIACSTAGSQAVGEGVEAGAGLRDATLDTNAPSTTPDSAATVADTGQPDSNPLPPPPGLSEAGPDGGCYAGSYELDAGPDADGSSDTCIYMYGCGLSGTGLGNDGCNVLQVVAGGQLAPIPQTLCWIVQDAGCDEDALAPGEGGALSIACTPCPTGGGRRPVGLRKPRGAGSRGGGAGALGTYLASLAFEEDASVAAFARMRAELGGLGAPRALVDAAGRAAKDEERHQRAMANLACARGASAAQIARARVRRPRGRGAAAMAAENAAEGCVRETYGALVARWQSVHAKDEGARRAFARIAADEARHAALSWAVARWIEPALGAAGTRRARRSRARALDALKRNVAVAPSAELARDAGLPTPAEARALLDAMARALELSSPTTAARR